MKYIGLEICKKLATVFVAITALFTPAKVEAAEVQMKPEVVVSDAAVQNISVGPEHFNPGVLNGEKLIDSLEILDDEVAMADYSQVLAAKLKKYDVPASHTMEKKYTTTQKVKNMGYWCYRPIESKDAALPLIIYLHGSDGRGNNLDRLMSIEGIPQYINKGLIYPNAIVIAPQCPAGSSWNALSADVMTLINHVITEENVDTNRISLTGASLGGMGTFTIAVKNPNFFASVVPVCGSVNAASCSVLNNTAVRIFHGTKDYGMGFSVKSADEVIRNNGGNCELVWLQGEGHEIRHVYIDEQYDLINWMINQKRPD